MSLEQEANLLAQNGGAIAVFEMEKADGIWKPWCVCFWGKKWYVRPLFRSHHCGWHTWPLADFGLPGRGRGEIRWGHLWAQIPATGAVTTGTFAWRRAGRDPQQLGLVQQHPGEGKLWDWLLDDKTRIRKMAHHGPCRHQWIRFDWLLLKLMSEILLLELSQSHPFWQVGLSNFAAQIRWSNLTGLWQDRIPGQRGWARIQKETWHYDHGQVLSGSTDPLCSECVWFVADFELTLKWVEEVLPWCLGFANR